MRQSLNRTGSQLHERGDPMPQGRSRAGTEEPNGRQLRRLLRVRRQRQCSRSTEHDDELAPSHELPSEDACAPQRNLPAYVGSGSWLCENEI